MRYGNLGPSGVPFRRARRLRRRGSAGKLNLAESGQAASVVPMRVRVEVSGGRGTTANMMRAYRILQQIELTGGVARIIEVAPDGSALIAEVDGTQAESLARQPFVRRIVSLN